MLAAFHIIPYYFLKIKLFLGEKKESNLKQIGLEVLQFY